ncbi:hypothetical protein D9M72_350890 [compost metagenome]
MGAALGGVGVEQRIAGLALDHHRQLPAQVAGVADAAVVALALPHRHDVRGIARQQHAAGAEVARQACVVGVDALADVVDLVRIGDDLADQRRHVLRARQVFLGLAGHDHELEAADAVRQRGRHIGPLGVAVHVDVRRADRVVAHVYHDPLVGLGTAFERQVERASHQAVAAVCTDHVGGADAHRPACIVGGIDPHAVVVVRERRHTVAQQRAHMREALQAFKQDAVGQRLDKGIAARPAELVGARLDRRKAAPARGDETHPVIGRGVRQQRLRQADRLEYAQRFVIEADGTRVVDDLRELFHQHHADALQAEDIGDHQADRPGTDDGDVAIDSVGTSVAARHGDGVGHVCLRFMLWVSGRGPGRQGCA